MIELIETFDFGSENEARTKSKLFGTLQQN